MLEVIAGTGAVFWIFVVFVVLRTIKDGKRAVSGAKNTAKPSGSNFARENAKVSYGSRTKTRMVDDPSANSKYHSNLKTTGKNSSGSLRNYSDLMEDRANDWLAKQLREEERVLRRGDLTDLGAAHSVDCDARTLKFEHLAAHNKLHGR